MSTVTVYRVGHLAQKNSYGLPSGPYTGPTSGIYSGAPAHRPGPQDDGIDYDYLGGEWCYGFATREQAAAWFADDADTLEAHHFAIWAVEVDDTVLDGFPAIVKGFRQIVYRASLARAVRAFSPGTFLAVDTGLDPAEVAAEKRLAAEIALAWDNAHDEERERAYQIEWRAETNARIERNRRRLAERRSQINAQALVYSGGEIPASTGVSLGRRPAKIYAFQEPGCPCGCGGPA